MRIPAGRRWPRGAASATHEIDAQGRAEEDEDRRQEQPQQLPVQLRVDVCLPVVAAGVGVVQCDFDRGREARAVQRIELCRAVVLVESVEGAECALVGARGGLGFGVVGAVDGDEEVGDPGAGFGGGGTVAEELGPAGVWERGVGGCGVDEAWI